MDPLLWTTIAEFWWVGPGVIGAGAAGWFGLRHQRAERVRRLGLEAARHDLRTARERLSVARSEAKVARAELVRVQAERAASHASSGEVADARWRLQQTQRDARAASATVRAARARLSAARATLPTSSTPPEDFPLARLMAAHDALTARWIEYETDAAKVLAFPTMSDGRQPLTAAHYAARAEAQRLRPEGARVTPAQFVAYRDAVLRLERAFEAAEAEAWRSARAAGTAPAGGPPPRRVTDAATPEGWGALAQQAIAWSATLFGPRS